MSGGGIFNAKLDDGKVLDFRARSVNSSSLPPSAGAAAAIAAHRGGGNLIPNQASKPPATLSAVSEMYFEQSKRMRFEDKMPRPASLVPGAAEQHGRLNVNAADYSNTIALSNILQNMGGGKYGNVTKEYEGLHEDMMKRMSSIMALRSQPSRPSPADRLPSRDRSGSDKDVIDLADDPDANVDAGEKKVDSIMGCSPPKDKSSVIVLDSDEEDGNHSNTADHQTPSSANEITNRAWLESQVQAHVRPGQFLALGGYSKQLILYDQSIVAPNRDTSIRSNWQPSIQYEKVVLGKETVRPPSSHLHDLALHNSAFSNFTVTHSLDHPVQQHKVQLHRVRKKRAESKGDESVKTEIRSEKVSQRETSPDHNFCKNGQWQITEVHCQVDSEIPESDGLDDLWKDMSIATECSKVSEPEKSVDTSRAEECYHSYMLEDDLGLVCRNCGVIQKDIETIFDYQWVKAPRSTRTNVRSSSSSAKADVRDISLKLESYENAFSAAAISIHPRHMQLMKPHQLEGFNFLVRNLISDNPNGCILAHAPGSGKTFMLISFIQSFLAKYPRAKPLVVLPKGILSTWKKEFLRWQIEDIPLLDFYSVKADNRFQQLDVLMKWEQQKSILFLGYTQFSSIICGDASNPTAAACQERLLKIPSLLILDEGHTPRNESTNVLSSLEKVQTLRKVVLSGTLFQNHVKEVFNILNLVMPKFLKRETSKVIRKRILSRVHIPGGKRPNGGITSAFCDLVEETLRCHDNFKRKAAVIQDLRELTRNVLHYYKGDFLDELPGLIDFTVMLKLGDRQRKIVKKLAALEKFKRRSTGTAVYIHPCLENIARNMGGDGGFSDESIDAIMDSLNAREGVKTKFFLNILALADAAGEKLLAFSQFLLPMKFLERLLVQKNGWRLGKEIFVITGDTSAEDRELSMEQFNTSPDAKVLFGSIKACGEGISLVGASRIIILDVHLNPSVTRQAIGRAFRPGQVRKVYTYRLVATDSQEEDTHRTSFNKELISKMWFEWSHYFDYRDFDLEKVDISDSNDLFLESPAMVEDIKVLYRR